ncbi:MAG: serine protease, partial [Planctomycetaceae bacterium]
TVGIYCERDEYQSYYGTGAVISADGHILTSTTVVPEGAKNIQVVFDGLKTRAAQIVELSVPLETTLIKVEAEGLPFFPLATKLPAVGVRAYTFGNAHNVFRINGRATFSMGVVSGQYEIQDQGGESLYAGLALETSAAVNPGSDGGPIVNQAGQLCAILSLNFSPLRWQGVGVPITELTAKLESLKSGKVATSTTPLWPDANADEADPLAGAARETQRFLVGVQVNRKFAPEILPRMPWDRFIKTLPDFDKKPLPERARLQEEYFNAARLLEVNQLLRRPPQPVTGVVISADGYILSSLFNVGEDMVFKEKSTGQPKKFEFKTTINELTKFNQSESLREANPIEKIVVTLGDGSQKEARVVARHTPLGLVLLKVEAEGLAYLDVQAAAAEPQLGVPVGLIGFVGNPASSHTLNTGIVSVPNRNRGLQFQTDALLNYGNSGGPVLTADGKLLGFAGPPIEPRTIMGRVLSLEDLNNWPMAPNSGVAMVARVDRLIGSLNDLKAGKSIEQLP